MRAIKFRLRIESKIVGYEKWYTGHTPTQEDPTGASPGWLYSKDGQYWNPSWIYHNKKDSFTGLLDKNGVEIYEGDIVRASAENTLMNWQVNFTYGSFGLERGEKLNLQELLFQEVNHGQNGIEVIGNIYQHPELLKP